MLWSLMAESDQRDREDPIAMAERRVGSALNAKWTIEKLLGVGGMGAVFAAKHRNGTRAALKLLHSKFAQEKDVRERFLREARIANRVDHPASVPVVDDDVSDAGEPFLVMELLEGGTLNELRKSSGGVISLEETLRIFDVVLHLLSKCHAVGIVHRDIKPGNIFITTDASVKVLDFGVARMHEPNSGIEATRHGIAIGTPSYIAPEQALGLGAQVDARSDIFSVGACMYVALTGERLNVARTEAESFVMAATQAAPSIANLAPDLPAEIVACVDRALAFEREKRFQDASAMRSEVLGLLAALRAGQLVRSAPKKEGGLKTRGNQALEDLEELAPAEKKEVQARLSGVWQQIGTCLNDVRQYGWSHPQAQRSMDAGLAQVTDALAAHPGSVRWDVGPGAFVFQGAPVWAPDRLPFDRIPYQLFADGVRHMQIREGFTREELRDLLAIFLRGLTDGAASEDDAVTALWDRRFEHVAYVAIESFAEGSEADPVVGGSTDLARELAASAQIDRDWHHASLEGRAMRLNLAAQLRQSGEAAAALALDPLQRATMGAQLKMSDDKWLERFVDAFADGYVDARTRGDAKLLEDAVREWTDDELQLHDHAQIFDMCRAVCAALAERAPAEAESFERDILRLMLPSPTLASILDAFAKAPADSSQEVAPSTLVGLEKALDAVGDASLLEVACACYGASRSEPLRAQMLAYVTRWLPGNEARIGALFESAPPELGVKLVGLLAQQKTTAAALALESAKKSPALAVRIEALTKLSPDRDDEVRVEVRKMLEDLSAVSRMEALDLVAERGLLSAGPAVVLQIQAPTFHARSVDERREWLSCLVALNPPRALDVCCALLKEHALVPTEATESTRVLAAEVLSTMASKDALEAANEAAKKRFWNSAPVREASERAAQRIQALIANGVAEPVQISRKPKGDAP
jgi:serine/threonine protein kinase